MARQSNTTTVSPLAFTVGAPILYGTNAPPDVAPAVLEQLNWSWANRPVVHASGACGEATWDGNHEPRILSLAFTGVAGDPYGVKLKFQIKINPDVLNLVVGARCAMANSGFEIGNVRVTVGSATPVVWSFALADNGTLKTSTVATSSSGTGWQTVTYELQLTASIALGLPVNFLSYYYVQDQSIASIPAPTNV